MKDEARHRAEIADLVEQLEALDAERYEAQTALEEARRLLLDVEGSLLAYWTDISQAEVQRLTVEIRRVLGAYEPAKGDAA